MAEGFVNKGKDNGKVAKETAECVGFFGKTGHFAAFLSGQSNQNL